MADTCINGRWEEGICVCNQGYDIGFNDLILNPKYCENESVAIVDFSKNLLSSGSLLHYAAMAVTVTIATWGILGVCSVYFSVIGLCRLKRAIERVELEHREFKIKQSAYDGVKMKNAGLWDPPEKDFKCFKIKEN